MLIRPRPLAATLALTALAFALASAAAPNAAEVLRASAARYQKAKRLHLAGEILTEVSGPKGRQSGSAQFEAASAPGGKVRDDLKHPSAGGLRVSNGERTWMYVERLSQYLEQSVAGPSPTEMDTLVNQGMIGLLLTNYRGMGDGIAEARRLPDETLTISGRKRPCDVIEVRYKPGAGGPSFPGVPRTYWIDKDKKVVLRQRISTTMTGADGKADQTQTETFEFTVASLDETLDDKLFGFTPPSGAKKVNEFTTGRSYDDLTGETAIDFTLPDLEGQKHRLRDHRGSVVLLDFWATWCGPCRIQMPNVEKLHHEFKDKGLVVYAINQGEASEKARQSLEKNKYTTTTLLDPKI